MEAHKITHQHKKGGATITSKLYYTCKTDTKRIKEKLSELEITYSDVQESDLHYQNAPQNMLIVHPPSEKSVESVRKWMFLNEANILYPHGITTPKGD